MSVTYFFETANGLTSAATTTTSGMTIVSNEVMLVTSGSTVSAADLVVSAVDLTGSGTAATSPSGIELVYSGGGTSATISGITEPLAGGGAIVTSGGLVVGASVGAGGGIIVDGGTTSTTTISGGFESVFSGGLTSGTTVSAGAQSVFNGGVVSASTIDAGSYQEVYSGGVTYGATLDGTSIQDVYAGGAAWSTQVDAGGTQTIHAGGAAYLNVVAGTADIYGYENQNTISGTGVETVMSGGTAAGTYLISGGTQVVSAGGTAQGVLVELHGFQTVTSGGTLGGSAVLGGTVNIQSGGVSFNMNIGGTGGEVVVSAGGTLVNTIANAGLIEVLTGGVTSGTALAGGQEIVLGGTTNATTVYSGGSEIVMSGGAANHAVVASGGSIVVEAGGTVSNLSVVGAGVVSLLTGAAVTGDIVLSGSGGEVQFVGTTLPTVTLDGLAAGDKIDLSGISGGLSASYAHGILTVLGASGTLATLDIGAGLGGGFSVGVDSAGGTLITFTAAETAAAAVAASQAGSLPALVAISDSAADVAANLAGLESIAAAGKLGSITLTDIGYATLSVTAAQLSADAAVINAISGDPVLVVDASATANATITGLAGHGTVVSFSGAASQYSVTSVGDGSGVTVAGAAIGTDHISDATILKFSDYSEVLASSTVASGAVLSAANIAELYAAGLGRAPDAAGMAYYETLLQSTPGLTATTVASWFLSSPEYTANAAHDYAQTTAGDGQFVSDLYTNLLHRTGSTAEISYYQNIISQFTKGVTAGTAAYSAAELAGHAVVLADFSASAEFLANIQITAQNPASAQHWLVLL